MHESVYLANLGVAKFCRSLCARFYGPWHQYKLSSATGVLLSHHLLFSDLLDFNSPVKAPRLLVFKQEPVDTLP